MCVVLIGCGWLVGVLYWLMNNEVFNCYYIFVMQVIVELMFLCGWFGLVVMLCFLKGGGWLFLGYDQFDDYGVLLWFFGLFICIVLILVEFVICYEVLILFIVGICQFDGLSFCVEVGVLILYGEFVQMMQVLNDYFEVQVCDYMDQWFWVYWCWKQCGNIDQWQMIGFEIFFFGLYDRL